MSEEKRTIEVTTEFLDNLYGLIGKVPPGEKNINIDLLTDLVFDIRRKIDKLQNDVNILEKSQSVQKKSSVHSSLNFMENESNKKQVLIIDDLGVITYQLSVLFRNLDYEVVIAKEIYDAINKYKKQYFNIVIMDLFIPTDREGFILLDELVKLTRKRDADTMIGVMTASNKKEHRQQCMSKGADFFIEKIEDWQNELIQYCEKQ